MKKRYQEDPTPGYHFTPYFKEKDKKKHGNAGKGRRHSVGDQRMTEKEISQLTGKSQGYVWSCLQKESAEHFIKRVGTI